MKLVNQLSFLGGNNTHDVLTDELFLVDAFVTAVLGQSIGNLLP